MNGNYFQTSRSNRTESVPENTVNLVVTVVISINFNLRGHLFILFFN